MALSTPGKEKGNGRDDAKTFLRLRYIGQALTAIRAKLLVRGDQLTEALLHVEPAEYAISQKETSERV